MSRVRVTALARRPGDALHVRYDSDVDILVAECAVPHAWTLGVDVDGRIVFDLDAERVLRNLDFHIPRRRWAPATHPWLDGASPAALRFDAETVAHKSLSIDLRATFDAARRVACVRLGPDPASVMRLALGPDCAADVADGTLCALWFRGV